MLSTNASDVADDLLDEFEEFEDDFEEERQRALEEARDEAKRVVPVDTGRLRDAIEVRGNAVVADTDYASFVDQGTIYQEPTFFLTDAARDSFNASLERLRS